MAVSPVPAHSKMILPSTYSTDSLQAQGLCASRDTNKRNQVSADLLLIFQYPPLQFSDEFIGFSQLVRSL